MRRRVLVSIFASVAAKMHRCRLTSSSFSLSSAAEASSLFAFNASLSLFFSAYFSLLASGAGRRSVAGMHMIVNEFCPNRGVSIVAHCGKSKLWR